MHIADKEVVIRPATEADAEGVREFLEGLSPDSRWLRYHAPAPRIPSWMVDAVVKADHDRRESLLALVGDRIVGIAEWGRLAPLDTHADVGVVVDEQYRRHGIARRLLRRLAMSGVAHGIDTFEASVLATNRPTIALTQDVAPVRSLKFDGPVVTVSIPLSQAS